eukprot:SAG31_NODE_3314_length_4427_cov_3.391174_3_plen_75_part_00
MTATDQTLVTQNLEPVIDSRNTESQIVLERESVLLTTVSPCRADNTACSRTYANEKWPICFKSALGATNVFVCC